MTNKYVHTVDNNIKPAKCNALFTGIVMKVSFSCLQLQISIETVQLCLCIINGIDKAQANFYPKDSFLYAKVSFIRFDLQ